VRAPLRAVRLAVCLSAFAPLATLASMLASASLTQVADFVRRSVELLSTAISYRIVASRTHATRRELRERWATRTVVVSLLVSAFVIATLALVQPISAPGGRVELGLAVAVAGAATNTVFAWRFARLAVQCHDQVMRAQGELYRAKVVVDLAIGVTLTFVLVWPDAHVTLVLDRVAAWCVTGYLTWTARGALLRSRSPEPEGTRRRMDDAVQEQNECGRSKRRGEDEGRPRERA